MPSAAARVVGIPRPVNIPIGKAYYVPTQFFLNKVLPRPPAGLNLNTTIERAPRTVVTQYGKLWGYSDKSPAGVRKKGVNNAFASLSRDIHTIVKTVDSHRPTIIFYHNKEGRADFQQRPTNSLPDAFFIPAATAAGFVQWSDVAVFGEYRKGGSQDDINENIKKASQTMRNCMRNDPRRRFLYGFTAEDSHMKFWYCDRSQIVLSEPINFIEEPHNLLRFVLSLSFAPLHQLGWDPTMTPTTKDGKLQYDITLRTNQDDLRVYRTISVLSDHTAHDVLGRASRVWKAVRLVDGEETGEPVALKDSWVDSTREREGDVYAKVMQAILAEGREQEAKNLFVTVQAHGDVYVAGSQDRTPSFLSQRRERFAASKDSAVPGPSSGKASEWIESRYQVHHRIVFNEVGQPLAEVTSLETMFKVLHDVFRAAAVMHKSGWVHRDISAGNILIVNGSGRLTDLEYALNEEYQDEPGRTGTPFFVAVEIDSGNYLFDPILKRIPQPEASKKPTALDILMKTGYLGPLDAEDTVRFESPPPTPPFRYNPLHDLESLWWIAVYFTLNRETDGAHDRVAQRSAVREFFYNHENRQHALLLPTYFADKVRCLHASLGDIAKLLNKLRALLSRAYREAEKTFQLIDFCVANEYHDVIASIFQAAAEYSKVKKISIRRFSDTTWDNITC